MDGDGQAAGPDLAAWVPCTAESSIAGVIRLGWNRLVHRLRPERPGHSTSLEAGAVAEGFSATNLDIAARIPVLTNPTTVRAATLELPASELVLGVDARGESRMYPTSTMRRHHIANDRLAEEPLVVCFCVKCFSGVGFDPVVDGVPLTFAVYGLHKGTFVMRDHQTGTIWAHVTGEALAGPHAGRRLEQVPVQMTAFVRWLELHPDSLAPHPSAMATPRRVAPGQSELGPKFRSSRRTRDRRLPDRTFVLGVRVGGGSRAYVVDPDHPGPPLFQDELAGVPLVLLAWPGAFPVAFDRRLGTDVVDLRLGAERIVDASGSVWDPEGRAIDGPRAGEALRFLPSRLIDWYAWVAYHPESQIADLRPGPRD